MKRIAIIGCSGSGKSTLAFKLHEILKLPIYHLDQYYWKPNWQQPEFEKFQVIHNQICDKNQWIIDGIYSRTLPYRFDKADVIIFLDLPRYICLFQVCKRILLNYNKITSSSAPSCPERFDLNFFKWIWNYKKCSRVEILLLLQNLSGVTSQSGVDSSRQVFVLQSQKEIDLFVKKLSKTRE